MFSFLKKKEEVAAPTVQKEIVVVGNSVVTLYRSVSLSIQHVRDYPHLRTQYTPTPEQKTYHQKFWLDPADAFRLGGKDCQVTQCQSVMAADGKAYLLDVSHIVSVEEGTKE